jgi:hypothetical protein
MFDRFNLTGQAEDIRPKPLQFMVLISFKSGFMRGSKR